jgi:hypothetical protein
MKLNILAGGNMADSGRVGVGYFGDPTQLVGCEPAKRDFDTHHLNARLALSINPVLQAKGLEQISGKIAGSDPPDFSFERFNLFYNRRGNGDRLDFTGASRPDRPHVILFREQS